MPSGNFGNLTAGIFAKRIGLPVAQVHRVHKRQRRGAANICAAANFAPHPALATYSNAMDVGNPNNFPRLLDLCRNRLEYVQKEIWGHGATDAETSGGDENGHEKFGYIADPHTAVGILGWEAYRKAHPEPAQGLVLATAHPAKFAEIVRLMRRRCHRWRYLSGRRLTARWTLAVRFIAASRKIIA